MNGEVAKNFVNKIASNSETCYNVCTSVGKSNLRTIDDACLSLCNKKYLNALRKVD